MRRAAWPWSSALGGVIAVAALCLTGGSWSCGSNGSSAAVDAGATPSDTGGSDTNAPAGESGGPDAPSSNDAPVDSPVDSAGEGGASPCMAEPPGTLFCADFDHVSAVNQGWTLADVHGDGAGALDTSTFVSPPASFRATAGGADASMPSVYELQFTGSASTATYILELDVRFHASMDTATGVFVATYYPNEGINFYLAQGSLVAAE